MTTSDTKHSNNTSLSKLIMAGVFVAVTAILSWISIPLPFSPVPVNLALLGVFLAGVLLGPLYGAASMTVYVLLGAVGVPVFHGFTGGMGIIAGPTGGFIIGYILAAFIAGLYRRTKTGKKYTIILFLIAALLACYTAGLIWFVISTGSDLKAALIACVIPFIPGDILKILATLFLVKRIKPC